MAALARAAKSSATSAVGRITIPQFQEDGLCLAFSPQMHAPLLKRALRHKSKSVGKLRQPLRTEDLTDSRTRRAQRLRVSAVASVEAKPEAEEQKLEGAQKLWNAGKVTSTEEVSPGVRIVTLEIEISREVSSPAFFTVLNKLANSLSDYT